MGPRLHRQYERVLAGTDQSARAAVLRGGLRAASWAYGLGTQVRNGLYDAGVLRSHRVAARVISVGNVTAGGTGKTPIAIALAQRHVDAGDAVALLTRGYMGAATNRTQVQVVSDGEGTRWAGLSVGDEALLLAERVPRAAVLACPDRLAAARYAIEQFGAGVLILDDGFQHRRIARDEDWVVIDASNPWGHGALLPRGLLREPPRALARATSLVISRADQADRVEQLATLEAEMRRHNPDAPLFWATHDVRQIWRWPSREVVAPDALQGRRILAMSGIGNPAAFEATVRGLGATIGLVRRFADHHPYKVCDLESAHMFVRSESLAGVVTTEKDAVRLEGLTAPDMPIWVIGIEAHLHTTRPAVENEHATTPAG